MKKKGILFLSSLFVLVQIINIISIINYAIDQKEFIDQKEILDLKLRGEIVFSEEETVVYLRIAERGIEPGNSKYVLLRYDIQLVENPPVEQQFGYIVIFQDQNKVGRFKRYYNGEKLAAGEKLIEYYRYECVIIRIVPEAVKRQKVHNELYERVRYAIFKFSSPSNYTIVGFADENFQLIVPN